MKSVASLATAMALFLSVNTFGQSVDELIDKHIAALGGLDKLNSITSIYTERTVRTSILKIPTKVTIQVGKASRTEFTLMGMKTVIGVDGSSGWETIGPNDAKILPQKQLKQMISGLDPFGNLVHYKEKGNTVELVGKELMEGKDVYHLKVTTKERGVSDEYLDAQTYLVSRIKTDEVETVFSDYQDVYGVKFPYSLETLKPNGKSTVAKIELNVPVDESMFKNPSSTGKQTTNYQIQAGVKWAIPTGLLTNTTGNGFGGFVKGMYGLGKINQYVTLEVGYIKFLAKDQPNGLESNLWVLPIYSGYRYKLKGIVLDAQAGLLVNKIEQTDWGHPGNQSRANFTYALGVGYELKNIELGAKYQFAEIKDSDESLSFLCIRVGYSLTLGKKVNNGY